MNRIIVDASVGAKWFFDEEGKDRAAGLLQWAHAGDGILCAPDLFFPEMANIFTVKIRRGKCSYPFADFAFRQLLRIPLECHQDKQLSEAALENAWLYGISAYDALYVSLAEIFSAPLVTADEALIKALRKRGFLFVDSLESLDFPGLF